MTAKLLIITLTYLAFNINHVYAQDRFKQNDVYFELLGNGGVGSLNYERQLANKPGPGVRVGIGFYPNENGLLSLPLGFNYLVNLKNEQSFIDAGLGLTLTGEPVTFLDMSGNVYDDGPYSNIMPSIGYRRHTEKNLMFRFNLAVILNKHSLAIPTIGFSIGKRF